MHTVLITGDREWSDRPRMLAILQILCREHKTFRLIHGDARGADRMSGEVAEQLVADGEAQKIVVERRPADWNQYRRAAGLIRNQAMLDEFKGEINMVLAFHNNLNNSKGTKDMVLRSLKAGLEVRIITSGSIFAAVRAGDK